MIRIILAQKGSVNAEFKVVLFFFVKKKKEFPKALNVLTYVLVIKYEYFP